MPGKATVLFMNKGPLRGNWHRRKSRLLKRVPGFVLTFALAVLLCCLAPGRVEGHGVRLSHESRQGYEVTASHDTGSPMALARVLVFAPDDPRSPWLTGVSDEQGRFAFFPDRSRPGTWVVQVRQHGHGGMIHIPVAAVGNGQPSAPAGSGLTGLQRVLMAALVAWGCLGTALYFRGRRHR